MYSCWWLEMGRQCRGPHVSLSAARSLRDASLKVTPMLNSVLLNVTWLPARHCPCNNHLTPRLMLQTGVGSSRPAQTRSLPCASFCRSGVGPVIPRAVPSCLREAPKVPGPAATSRGWRLGCMHWQLLLPLLRRCDAKAKAWKECVPQGARSQRRAEKIERADGRAGSQGVWGCQLPQTLLACLFLLLGVQFICKKGRAWHRIAEAVAGHLPRFAEMIVTFISI